jgi:hypothetical protein
MLLTTIGSPAWTSTAGLLPAAQRRFFLVAIRSALVTRHPELRVGDGASLGVIEMHLDRIVALAQRAMISGMSGQVNDLLDKHVCPRCIYNAPSGECEMRDGAQGEIGGCMLRRYGPTIVDAAKHAILKLAGSAAPTDKR